MKIVLIGAGSTGRGHLAALLFEQGIKDITFVDKNKELISTLKKSGGYRVRLLGENEKTLDIRCYSYLHTSETEEINKAMTEADMILTAVLGENLSDAAETVRGGLEARKAANVTKTCNVIGCENLDRASSVLKKFISEKVSPDMKEYMEKYVGFPDAMISRVVPLATEHPTEIVAENYNEWVIDKPNFKGEEPGWPFFDVADDMAAKLERKLWIHNGGHATVAYLAFLRGHKYIHEAVADPVVADFAMKVLDELGDTIIHKYGYGVEEIRAYEINLCKRGAIAEMKDEIARVVRNPIRKLGIADRLVAPAIYAENNGLKNENIIKSIRNITKYYSPDDEMSVVMHNEIEAKGLEGFLKETIGLIEYPKLVEKICKED